MGDFIALLFLARELAHRAHLKATGPGSYATHIALNEFYDAIVGKADAIAEAYQGQFQELLDIPLLEGDSSLPIDRVLREQLDWIAANRYAVCPREQSAIQNLIDEAVSTYQSTLYKLRFLS